MWYEDKDALIYLADMRIDELETENAKLRVELTDLRLKSCPSCGIKVENEELRELVRDMWEFGFGDNSGANDAWAWHERADELADRMAELGIGVEQ